MIEELKGLAMQSKKPFKVVVNQALRAGLKALHAPRQAHPYRSLTFSMGSPHVPLDKALGLASELEDAEIARKLELRK